MTTEVTTAEALNSLDQSAEAIRNNELQVFPAAASTGDCVRQGDLYIELVSGVPDNYQITKPVKQLVLGTTQGSRHCLSHLNVRMFVNPNPGMLEGPMIIPNQDVVIEHPEHGDWKLQADRCYSISYQQNQDALDRAARVLD